MCNGKHSCRKCAWCTGCILFCMFVHFCYRADNTRKHSKHSPFVSFLATTSKVFFFFYNIRLSAAWTGLLVLLKLQLGGTSLRPGWLASQWVAAFEIHRDSPKQREPPHSPGKWCPGGESGQHREQAYRSQKGRAIWTTPRHTASPGVAAWRSAAADAGGWMQRPAPMETQDGHLHLKGGIKAFFFLLFFPLNVSMSCNSFARFLHVLFEKIGGGELTSFFRDLLR